MVNLNNKEVLALLKSTTPKEIHQFYKEPYKISEEDLNFYDANGYIKLTGILSGPALDYTRKIISAVVSIRKEHDKRTLAEKSQYEQSFMQCGYLCWDYPAVKDFVFGKRFANIARELMGGLYKVRLWHDQALFKEPHGRKTDIHIDSSYWPLSNPQNSTTMWLALTKVTKDKGSLYFYPGSHKWNAHEYVDIFKNPHEPAALKGKKSVSVELEPGDATFHSGLTYHGANQNKTDDMREAMTVIYIRDGSRFDATDERNATHTSCKGLEDGEIIRTEYTPTLSD